VFLRCNFAGANLTEADLRGSTFEECTFERADMGATLLYRRSTLGKLLSGGSDQSALPLSAAQRAAARWSSDNPEPGGG
jgi:uncharacterized protein YjbI with pentapeptide repeats